MFIGGCQARIRGNVVHIQLHLFDLRLHILFGRDIPRGGLVAFRKLNVVEIHGNTFADIHVYLLYHTRSIDGVDHFIYSFRSRRRSGKHFFGAVFVYDTERNFGTLLDSGFEDVRSIRLVFYLAAETVGDRRNLGGVGCGKPGLYKFAPIDIQICSVRVRPRSYDIRNALFDTVPFPDKLFSDIVAGAELKIRNLVFGFVGCRIIGVFGCFVPIRALEIARCTGFDTAHDVTTFALRPDVTHIVRCSRCYDEYTTFGISRVLRPRRLLQGLYRIAVGDRRPFIGSVLFFYPPPRFARIGVRRLVARYGEVNLRVFRRSDFGIIGFADDKSYVGIVASDGIALAPYVTCYNRSG